MQEACIGLSDGTRASAMHACLSSHEAPPQRAGLICPWFGAAAPPQRCGLSVVYCCTGPDPVTPYIPEEGPPHQAAGAPALALDQKQQPPAALGPASAAAAVPGGVG